VSGSGGIGGQRASAGGGLFGRAVRLSSGGILGIGRTGKSKQSGRADRARAEQSKLLHLVTPPLSSRPQGAGAALAMVEPQPTRPRQASGTCRNRAKVRPLYQICNTIRRRSAKAR